MACVTAAVGNIYFVRWHKPEVEDMTLIVRELAARRRETGHLLTYVGLAPESSDPPGTAARSEMPKLMNHALIHCEEMHIVMEGVGFKHSVMRSVMAAVFLAGGKRDRVHVHARMEDIVHGCANPELSQALRILALRGLLTDLPQPASGSFMASHPALRRPTG
jgi:hypothetical protein